MNRPAAGISPQAPAKPSLQRLTGTTAAAATVWRGCGNAGEAALTPVTPAAFNDFNGRLTLLPKNRKEPNQEERGPPAVFLATRISSG